MVKGLRAKTQKLRLNIAKLIIPHAMQNLQFAEACFDKYVVKVTPRPMTWKVVKEFGERLLTGAEVGVGFGLNAESILKELNMETLYLIDIKMTPQATSLNKYGNIQWLIMKSEEAYKHILEPLDFVYIDGNHTYPYVKSDLENYYPAIKHGGIIGGHDYHLTPVKQAAEEFAKSHGLTLCWAIPDFWMVKP